MTICYCYHIEKNPSSQQSGIMHTSGQSLYYATPPCPQALSSSEGHPTNAPFSPFPISYTQSSSCLQMDKHRQSTAKEFLKTARSPYCFDQQGVSAWCKRVRPSNVNNNNNNTNPLLFWGGGISVSSGPSGSPPRSLAPPPWVPPLGAFSGSEGLLRCPFRPTRNKMD